MRALAHGGVDRERDEVGLRIVVLTDGAVLGGAGGVEIAEGGETEAMRGGEGFQGVFDVELGLAVGLIGAWGRSSVIGSFSGMP